jgi:CRP-like cAMP-binding protein
MTDMSLEDRKRLLSGLDFFSGCTDRQLTDISQLAGERAIATGDELCRQGEFENEVFVITAGVAEVIVDGATVGTTHVGEIVGELSMLGTGRRAATLRVTDPMRVLVFEPDEIDSVLAADPSSARRLSQHGGQAPSEPGS